MGGGKARTGHPRRFASGFCQISFYLVVTICIAVEAGGRIGTYRRHSQFSFANYASARLFVANTILLRNLFS
jgi:hypothetical protein